MLVKESSGKELKEDKQIILLSDKIAGHRMRISGLILSAETFIIGVRQYEPIAGGQRVW
jgi:hypothetical protein